MPVDGNDLISDMMAETLVAANKYGITPDALMRELKDELGYLEPVWRYEKKKKKMVASRVKTFKAMRIRQEARRAAQQVLGILGAEKVDHNHSGEIHVSVVKFSEADCIDKNPK